MVENNSSYYIFVYFYVLTACLLDQFLIFTSEFVLNYILYLFCYYTFLSIPVIFISLIHAVGMNYSKFSNGLHSQTIDQCQMP